jgi:hypothetical protein
MTTTGIWRVWGLMLALMAGLTASAAEKAAEASVVELRARATEERIKKDLSYLASDELEGRGPATEGINKAADYIAAEFKKAGLKPAGQGGSWFQYFTYTGGARLSQPATLTFAGPKAQTLSLKAGTDFQPIGLSHSGAVRDAEVVFAGYGISTKEYDDYQGLDVAGKVVLVLRDAPRHISGPSRQAQAALVKKMEIAAKKDALAIVFINDSEGSKDGDQLLNFGYLATTRSPQKLPAFHVKRAIVDKMLANINSKDLATLEKSMNEDKKPEAVALKGWSSSLEVSVKRDGIELKNVIGVLEGKGKLADETLVIGAHYDHLGYGGFGSLARLKKMAIHNGADDNGSGTCGVIELARRFGAMKEREGRRLVFMTFSGEELGLLGSAHYCKAPIFPIENTAAMINLDMIGRLKKDGKTGQEALQIWGTGTAKTFDQLTDNLNKKYHFTVKKVASGFGPSDHSSFYGKKVPVFFFYTGDHPDYHRPSDKWDKINYDGMRRIVDMVEELAIHLATVPERPEYVKVSGGGGNTPRPRISLGIRPGYGEDKDGVLVDGVTEDRPAAKAGIKEGDRIIKMGDRQIKNLEVYMLFMSEQKKGDTIDVTVVRDKKELKLKVKLD